MPTEEQFNILVVDDEPSMREVLEIALTVRGFAVKTAQNGEQALQFIESESFDLVLTDLKMPDMNGLNLLRKIRERSPGALIVLTTGYASLDSAIEAMREGAYDYLTKPFRVDELYVVVNNARERVRLIKENKKLFDELKESAERRSSVDNRRIGDRRMNKRINEADSEKNAKGTGEQDSKNLELLQALQQQLFQVYTRTAPTDPSKAKIS